MELLWNISHDKHLPNEIIDQALAAHLKILDYNCLSVSKEIKNKTHEKFIINQLETSEISKIRDI